MDVSKLQKIVRDSRQAAPSQKTASVPRTGPNLAPPEPEFARTRPVGNYAGLIDPADLSQLGRVEVVATRVVEGYLSGRHRSPYKGSSVEFAEHRAYTPGDEVRRIDWRVWARSDRYTIKEFEEETNLQALLAVDASGSMGFGLSTVTKLRYAQMTAAILTRLLLHQQDAAGLAILGIGVRHFIPPRSTPRHFSAISDALERARPEGEATLPEAIHELARRVRRRGLCVLLSDCFCDLARLEQALAHLNARGQEILLLHVLAPEELMFDLDGWTRLEDLEIAGHRLDLDPPVVRRQYLEEFRRFLNELRELCGRRGIDYQPLRTDQPLGEVLGIFLREREARVRRR